VRRRIAYNKGRAQRNKKVGRNLMKNDLTWFFIHILIIQYLSSIFIPTIILCVTTNNIDNVV